MTKIKHFNQTRAIFQKLKYFWEPAIFIEVWNLALRSRLACAQWVWEWGRSRRVFPQKLPDPEELGNVNKGSRSGGAGIGSRT